MANRFLSLVVGATLFLSSRHSVAADKTIQVYFIGNSLTASTTLDRVHELFAQRGIDLQFGSQISGGKSLIRHLNYGNEPDQKWISWETRMPNGDSFEPDPNQYSSRYPERYGLYGTALKNHKWDKVVFQIYGSKLHDDLEAISGFIDLALKSESASNFYIYSTWPRRQKTKVGGEKLVANIDYGAEWESEYTASPDDTSKAAWKAYSSRSYTKKLLDLLNQKYPDLPTPVELIPVGEIISVIDRKIEAGELPGLEQLAERQPAMLPGLDKDTTFEHGANVLYADAVHFNPMPHQGNSLGIFISGSSLFAGLSGQSPVGLSGKPYGLDDTTDLALIEAIQKTIWDVITSDPLTGIHP